MSGKSAKEKPRDVIDSFEWESVVSAWRYFQHRETISANMYAGDVVERYWGNKGPYEWSDMARYTVAHQFTKIDFRKDGIDYADLQMSWKNCWAFMDAWLNGGYLVTVSDGTKVETVECFLGFPGCGARGNGEGMRKEFCVMHFFKYNASNPRFAPRKNIIRIQKVNRRREYDDIRNRCVPDDQLQLPLTESEVKALYAEMDKGFVNKFAKREKD